MIIVTGGAGFIGSNIVKKLNQRSYSNILVVDDLTDGTKFKNLVDCQIRDYLDKTEFLEYVKKSQKFANQIKGVFHLGACSDTTEWNGKFMMENNYDYSKYLLHYCMKLNIPFIYASSAAVYGANTVFAEHPDNESPLNVYGYSKLLFDQYVRRIMPHATSQVVGLRYFNVYGPNENHKGSMASVAFHFNNQIQAQGKVKLFEGTDGYGNGEQLRDFVYVDDIAKVNLWMLDHHDKSGIFNVGTGRSQTFNDVALSVIRFHNKGEIEYIPFPDHLKGRYQNYTQADISKLRAMGYQEQFLTVEQGVQQYLESLVTI